jgi:putative DNA primase/helicase
MARQYGFTPGNGDIQDAIITVARGNRFHPVREYLNGVKWDGEKRLPKWLKRAFGATDPEPYLEIIGPRFMVGAVARVMRPGCKMDNVMILEGTQGAGKSTIIRALFGEWFSDTLLPIGDKEAYQLIQGIWGFELGELDSFNKAEITELKRFFSQETDRYRPSYGRYVEDFPRQTVFIGSTNQEVYLRDYTGNRRYWPLYCAALDLAWVKANRDQLWAEAVHRYRKGEKYWVSQETPEEWETVCEAQDGRLQRDPWEDVLFTFLKATTRPWLTSADILTEGLGFDPAHIQQAHMNRIAPIMKSLGWVSARKRVDAGGGKETQRRVWERASQQQAFKEVPL